MTEQEAINYIENFTWSTSRLGLERTRELLSRLGDPQKKLKFIHIAGSNGKGSCSAMLASVFLEAGYKTGLYISPYIEEFRERIQINGRYIPAEALCRVTEKVRDAAEKMNDHPSQFELVTAAGMLYFAEEQCDIVMLEVGMGGALDSTNVIGAPECAVIMNIGLEHTEYLGNTLEEIAATKSGIIKPGCDAVLYAQSEEVTGVVRKVCAEKQVPLTVAGTENMRLTGRSLKGQAFLIGDREYTLALQGGHQLHNCAAVLAVIDAMRRRGWRIREEAVRAGLEKVRWPARLEIIGTDPLFLLDGGHNPQCAEALAAALKELFPGRKFLFLCGILADKNYRQMLGSIRPFAEKIYCVTPESPRALQANALKAVCEELGIEAEAFSSVEEGLAAVLEADKPAVAFGSLYMAGAVRKGAYRAIKEKQRRQCREALASLTPEERAEKSLKITEALKKIPVLDRGRVLFAFRPTEKEPDILPCCVHARECFMGVAYPVTAPDGTMEAYVPFRDTELVRNRYGIEEPDPFFSLRLSPEEAEAVLIPCLGFDGEGRRLGHGKGYYDRYLARCPQALRILVAFEVQRLERVCAGENDLGADLLVTENGLCTLTERGKDAMDVWKDVRELLGRK